MSDNWRKIDTEGRDAATCQSIGEFIFMFSQLEFTIRKLLSGILNLTDEQFNAVVGLYDFAMLCKVTSAILQQQFPSKTGEIKEMLEKRCLELNTHRVRIAHGLWTHADDTCSRLVVSHLSRNSLKEEIYYENPKELDRLTNTAVQLMHEVLNLFPIAPG